MKDKRIKNSAYIGFVELQLSYGMVMTRSNRKKGKEK